MAEEDIYFAKLDQELIEALRQKKKKRKNGSDPVQGHTNQVNGVGGKA